MTIQTESNNNIHSVPTSTSIVTADSDQNAYYPSAPVVLIDDTDTPRQEQPTTHAIVPYSDDNYASAQVVGSELSPFSHQLAAATNTTATAVALDPWSKTPTDATTSIVPADNSNAARTATPARTNVVQQQGTAIFLEDPLHKKYRRRRRRRTRMAVSGMAGFVVGTLILGPIGAIVGAASGATIARAASKSGERRKDRRVEQQIHQLQQQHFNR